MRGGDTGSACWCLSHTPGISVATLRTWCVVAAAIVTLFILALMFIEQDKVTSCTKFKSASEQVRSGSHEDEQHKASIIFDALSKLLSGAEPPPSNLSAPAPKSRDTWDFNWDKRQWSNHEEAKNVGVRTVLLVRHGQYDLSTGILTDLGRRQANLTGKRLAEFGMNYKVIIHSPMPRAVETAKIIHSHLRHLPIQMDELLQEGGPTPPHPTITYWGLPDKAYFVDGPRMEAAFRKYFFRADKSQADQTFEILVGHGNIFRFFALRALQLPADAWMRVFIAHASITLLHINPDGTLTMTKFGDSGHFPQNMVTY